MITIDATYENGQIIWEERPPVQKKTKVKVIFLEDDEQPSAKGGAVRIGSLKGKIAIPDDFNEPLDDLKDYMY